MTVLAGLVLATTGTAQETVATLDVSAGDVQRMIEVGENNPMRSIDAGQHVVFVWYEVRRPRHGARVESRGRIREPTQRTYGAA